jgi:hypothetical protein
VRGLEVIVIDEVSMCSGELFELLSVMLQDIRGSSKYAKVNKCSVCSLQ